MGESIDRRGLWSDVTSPDVWVLLLALLTPMSVGATAVAWAVGRRPGGTLEVVLALIAGAALVADACFLVYYSADRGWKAFVLGGLLTGALFVGGLALCIDDWTAGDHQLGRWGLVLIALSALSLFLFTTNSDASTSRLELRRGGVTLACILLTVVLFATLLVGRWPAAPWARFGLAVAAAVIALRMVATEWSRALLIGVFLLLLLGVGSVLVQLGYEDLRDEQRERLVVAERVLGRLEVAKNEKLAALRAKAITDRRELESVLSTYPPPNPASATPRPTPSGADVVGNIVTALAEDPPNRADAEQAKRRLDVLPVDDDLVEWKTAAEAAAATAMDARSRADDYAPDRAEARAALTAARRAQEDQAHPRAYAWRLARLDLEVARYRAAVTLSDADADAARALELSGTPPDITTITLLDAVSQGPEAVASSLNDDEPVPLVPGPIGWLLVAAAAVVFWAALLRSNARQLAGPVTIEKVQGLDVDTRSLDTTFRIAVLQNLPEPGAAPGSVALQPVTDLLDVASVAPNWLASAVELAMKLTGQAYGYVVDVEVMSTSAADPGAASGGGSPKSTGASGAARALVRVRDVQTKRTLATTVLSDPTSEQVVRSAGLWASGYILSRSTRVPSWATWNADTATALSEATESRHDLTALGTAARTAPNSGLLLYLLSDAYELAGRPIDALHAVARAVASHPRYRVAQYRLAAGLAMMSAHHFEDWAKLPPDSRQPVSALLKQIADRRHLSSGATKAAEALADRKPIVPTAAATHFDTLSEALFVDLIHRTRFLPFLAATLRRSERDPHFAMAVPFGSAQDERRGRLALARSARLVPPGHDERQRERDEFITRAAGPDTRWQETYNAACARARDERLPDAMRLLEACLTKRGIHQLTSDWLEKDPDLEALQGWPRFVRFTSQIRQGGRNA